MGTIPLSKLGRFDDSAKLGSGATADVYRTGFRLPEYPGALVYKQFLAELSIDERRKAVSDFQNAVSMRGTLSADDMVMLDHLFAWPLALVTDGDKAVGGLMPSIRDEFFAQVTEPRTKLSRRIPRGVDRLSGSSASAFKAGFTPEQLREFAPRTLRLALVAQIVYAIAWLHRRGIVYGDLSLKNSNFSVNPPRITLVDCDGVASINDANRSQFNTPSFLAPECRSLGTNPYARGNPTRQDFRTDVYKLGLCIVRGLLTGDGVVSASAASHLQGQYGPEVVDIADRALREQPDARPTAAEIYGVLRLYIDKVAPPPQIKWFRVSEDVVPRGGDVILEWQVENATSLKLMGPDGSSVAVDPLSERFAWRAGSSGSFTLYAWSATGSAAMQSGDVRVFELPKFELLLSSATDRVLQLYPPVPAVEVGSFDDLPARPSPDARTYHAIPPIVFPDTSRLVEGRSFRQSEELESGELRWWPLESLGDDLGLSLASAGGSVREAITAAVDLMRIEIERARADGRTGRR